MRFCWEDKKRENERRRVRGNREQRQEQKMRMIEGMIVAGTWKVHGRVVEAETTVGAMGGDGSVE